MLTTNDDIRAAEREQWDDGNNYLAVRRRCKSSPTSPTSRRFEPRNTHDPDGRWIRVGLVPAGDCSTGYQ